MADALDLGSSSIIECEFDSRPRHMKCELDLTKGI